MPRLCSKLEIHPNVVITPELAEKLLKFNTANRPIIKPTLFGYTKDMEEGNWLFAGNTIKISDDMVMRDGQHQLMAVVASGTTQVFNIQTGLDPRTFDVMDTGRKRSSGDVLAMKGFGNHAILSAAIKTTIFFEKYGRIKNNLRAGSISNLEVSRWADRKPLMNELVAEWQFIKDFKQNNKKGQFLAGSTWLFLYHQFAKRHKDQAKEFIGRLASGEDLSMSKNSAIYLLREKLLTETFGKEHMSVLRQGGSAITELKVRFAFRAWNAWRSDEKITKLVVDKQQDKLEKPI